MAGKNPDTLPGYQKMFPDEAACAAYLEHVRRPNGFVCSNCGAADEPRRMKSRTRVLRCRHCLEEISLASGTVMHGTRTPLNLWFRAAFMVTATTPGWPALQLRRKLGLARYGTAFQMLHKLRAGLVRPDRDPIGGDWPTGVDETLAGGRARGEGRGPHHKIYVVGAVGAREKIEKHGRRSVCAGRLRLQVLSGRSGPSLETFVTENILPGTHVTTDGCPGYGGLRTLGYGHDSVVLDGDAEKTGKELPMTHLVFSNPKAWLLGTHHGVSQRHLPAYLNEFVFRFDRRFYPATAFASARGIGSHVTGPTYRESYDGARDHKTRPEIVVPL